mgnify:CR=1
MKEVGIFTAHSRTLGKCTSIADNPCVGVCSTSVMPDDDRCRGCGRTWSEVRDWNILSKMERKIINLRNAEENYSIRQLKRGNCVEAPEMAVS